MKPGETPDDDDARDVHALLYDTYVRNSLCAYPKDEFVDLQTYDATVSDPDGVKLVAYYLPQFHAIPENDRWWGPGFTEWRNVARAFPHFADHYQPRVPGELGYYDLRVVDVMRRQAELARNYGISAFCFHFYWFNSKTLLELPIKNFFDNKDIDIGFSLCWANENWSRRWDGSEHELLISQEHSPEDDVAFIRHVAKYFSDPRYLRVDGKPILTVYRPSILPNPGETVRRWREEVERLGFPGIYLIATNAFAFTDYKSFGFDALSEFPPHHVRAQNVREDFRLSRDFTGWRIRSYGEIVASELQRKPAEDSVIHPGVMPSWDNSPRRPHNGEIIHGSSPALFETWLTHAVDLAADNPARQRFVFINAWNEWAEGAYLEPDRRYGYAYLDKCRATLAAHAEAGAHANRIAGAIEPRADRSTVLVCAHWVGDEVFGGERSLIDVVRSLQAANFNVAVALPSGKNPAYTAELARFAVSVHILPYEQWTHDARHSLSSVPRFLELIREVKADLVYVNTIVVSAPLVAARFLNVPSVVHAREIIDQDPYLTGQMGIGAGAIIEQVGRSTDGIVANSHATARAFAGASIPVEVVTNAIDADLFDMPNEIRDHVRFGMISSNFPKKGVADFVRLASMCLKAEPRARFVIIGPKQRVAQTLARENLPPELPANVECIDYIPDVKDALRRVNVVVNFSQFQESFGRTVLEGMAARRPSLVYRWGALPELVVEGATGFQVTFGKPEEAVVAVRALCDDHGRLIRMGEAARNRALEEFSMEGLESGLRQVCSDVIANAELRRSGSPMADRKPAGQKIDIVICVHNALEETRRCLKSVVAHLSPGQRIIIVDDGSADDTRCFLEQFAAKHPDALLIRNDHPTGYTRAANLGLRHSSGDLVILLNSDTIVTAGWAGKMADAVFSMPGAGLVSPMSNAASLQSIPDIAGAGNQTAINTLPPNLTIDELNACCEAWAREVSRPYVPLVHGFCFGITRKCLEIVGLFDELTFAKGYGEENDYCLRAIERGIWAVVATDTFVYHEKTRSYTEERRTALAASAQRLLYERYGRDAFLAYVGVLEREPSLVAIRSRARQLWDDRLAALSSMDATPRSIGEKSDAAWLDTLTRSVTSEFVDGVRYPRFPNDDLQRRTVGNAGVAAVREAFAFYRHVTEQLSRLQRPLAHDSRVLDFGVGWGRILRCFLREVDPSGLYGVDVSDTFLEAARSTSVPGTFDKIKPDGRLPYPDGYFDVAYAYSVFTHLPAALEHNWLSELSRTLKPGGVLVATVQPPRFIDFIENLSQDQVGRSNWYRELRTQLEAIEGPLETLTRDGFLFLATNNGTTYGDAIMTRKHVEDFWGRWFAIADFIDDESRFRQAVVTLRKIDEPRAIADEVRSDLALSVD